MLIRTAVPDDIPQIMSLAQQSKTAAHWSAREYDALFSPDAPERVAVVAVQELGVIAGFVVARCGAQEWEIENVVVDERVRRRGVGRLLMQHVLRRAQERGSADVFLEVRESNAGARALYKRLGFHELGRRPRYYHDPEEDAVVLRVSL